MMSMDAATRKRSLILIFSVVFFDLLGFGLVIPILPYYAREYGASASVMGWLMTCYSLAQLIFSPFWGALSDKYGRRPIMLMSIAMSSISMLIVGLAPGLFFIFLGRVLAGIGGANISTATAYIADVTDESQRAKAMGLIGAAFGLGFVFGPALGGYVSHWGLGMPAILAAGISAANFLFASKYLPEPIKDLEARKKNRRRINFTFLLSVIKTSGLPLVIAIFFLVTVGFAQMEAIYGFFVKDRFDLTAREAGAALALVGIIMVIVQGGLIGRLNKKFGEVALFRTGLVLMVLGLFASAMAPTLVTFLVSQAILAIGSALNSPSLLSLISRFSPPEHRGTAMGIYQSAGSLARILGPMMGGALYDAFSPSTPLFSAAALIAVALLVGLGIAVPKNI